MDRKLSKLTAVLLALCLGLTACGKAPSDQGSVLDGLLNKGDAVDVDPTTSAFTRLSGDESVKLYTSRVNTLYVKMGALAQALLDGADYAEAYDEVGEAITEMINTYNNYNT